MLTFYLHPVLTDGACGCGNEGCKRAGKHPAESWSQLPLDRAPLEPTADRGVGIATGVRSGVFVVDLDVKNGIDGSDELAKLGAVPPTYTVATPSGGFHLYFKHPGFTVRTSGPNSNPIARGVDIRGDGGYVVAPGSPHKNGGRYTIAADVPIADAPAWLLAWPGLKHADSEVAAPAMEVEERVASVPRDWRIARAKAWLTMQPPAVEGEGGDAHTWKVLTRAVHDNCLTDADMIAEALAEWNSRCSPPWSGKEWAWKVQRVLNNSTKEWSATIGMAYALETRNTAAGSAGSSSVPAPTSSEEPADPYHVDVGGLVFRSGGWDEPLSPPVYVVDQILVASSVTLFVAHGNSLKSMSTLSIAVAVATGRPWLGRFPVQQGPAVIVDYERNAYEARRRIKLLRADGVKNLFHCTQPAMRSDDPKFWDLLLALRPRFLVVDSLAAGALGTDENDKNAAVPLSLAQRFAQTTGAAVVYVHHANKGERSDKREKVRGSTAIFAAADAVYTFDPLESTDATKRLRVTCTKMNLGREPAPFAIELSDAKGLVLFEEPAAVAGRNAETSGEVEAAIRLHLASGRAVASVKELALAIGRRRDVVSSAVEIMEGRHELVKLPDAGGYRLDSPEQRRARVLSVVEQFGARLTSPTRLAKVAHVTVDEIDRLVLGGDLARAVNNAGGFIAVRRSG